MIMASPFLYPLLLVSAVYFGAAPANASALRGRRTLNDLFHKAMHDHDGTFTSSPVHPLRRSRRTRADDLVDEYVLQCSSYLLTSEDVVADGIISQNEFAEFIITQCRKEDICSEDMTLKFEQLDLSVQMKFITGICSEENFTDRSNCIYDLHDMWIEKNIFGLRTNDENYDVQSLIHRMCTEVYFDAVKMGFTKTTAPTSIPSTSKIPSMVPTLAPSRSSIPSSSYPTTSPITTTTPAALVDTPSYAPMSVASTNLESEGRLSTPSKEDNHPSSMPSDNIPSTPDIEVNPPLNKNENNDSFSKGTIVGAVVTLAFVIVASLYAAHKRPPRSVTTKETCTDPTHNQWDTTISPETLDCLGMNQSTSSSSSSLQDNRFINVYSSEGSPIPQFNPSTAGAVVIGTVSIGSSSYSSEIPRAGANHLTNDCGSESTFSTPRMFLSGVMNTSGSESRNASSLLTGRSFRLNESKSVNVRHCYTKKNAVSSRHDHGLPSSPTSCKTMPLTLSCGRQLQSLDSSDDRKEVTSMGTAAVAGQSNFVFDLERSLSAIPSLLRFGSSESDAGASSVLCKSFILDSLDPRLPHYNTTPFTNSMSAESFFTAEFSYIQSQSMAVSLQAAVPPPSIDTTPSHVLVPWRKEGFSGELEFSDSNESDKSDSESSVTCTAPPLRKKRGLLGPSKRLLAVFRKKTKAKFSLRSKQYQHLRGAELHEDPSVLSLSNSYLSETNLIAQQRKMVFPGTFAAATQPLNPGSEELSLVVNGQEESALETPNETAIVTPSASNCDGEIGVADMKPNEEIQGEEKSSTSVFFLSQFEASNDVSASSSRFSSISDSSSAGSQWYSDNLDCSLEEAAAANGDILLDTATTHVEDKIESSQIFSEGEMCESLEVSGTSKTSSGGSDDGEGITHLIGMVDTLNNDSLEGIKHLIGRVDNLSKDSLALSTSKEDSGYNTSILPQVVSDSSEEMSFPSDESSPFDGLAASKSSSRDVDSYSCSEEPSMSSVGSSSNECAANAIAWAIKNEVKKLEGNIRL